MTFQTNSLLLTAMVLLVGCQSHKTETTYVPDDDMCGASQFQNYVGQPLNRVVNQRFGTQARAIAYDSVVSMDFNLRRLNFMADKQGNIVRVYCG
ncbi:I78 family peptidase inhibitor [Tatumella saanichensis]|uniref:I78 family peptidase inhibitor n=1 Tax=Tatumella saanichensis TaxID=480813 RepID=UPI0004A22418|nr:I78 family peptidase inhibitor [Tatumella saanichensis]